MATQRAKSVQEWTDEEREITRQHFERWKSLGPLLESIRHDELRAMSEQDYFKAVERVWSVDVTRSKRYESGLVEFQKVLSR
jgi:hypothetical protein